MQTNKAHSDFAKKYGDAHIATPLSFVAVQHLAKKVSKILEIGAGVGTLTFAAINANPKVSVEAYEDSEYCISEFRKNLAGVHNNLILHTDLRVSPVEKKYDLVIVDGGANKGDCGYPGMTADIFMQIDPKMTYFEGVRRGQRKIVRKIMRDRGYWLAIRRLPFQMHIDAYYKGGTLMTCIKNTSKFKSWKKYLFNEIYESQSLEIIFGKIKPPF
jgi:hypothetical protein